MNLQRRLLFHIAKAHIAHLYDQVPPLRQAPDDVRTLDGLVESYAEHFTLGEAVEVTTSIKRDHADDEDESLYLAAAAVGQYLYALSQDNEKTDNTSLTIVLAEIAVALDLNV
jgi:hypothetical protein